MPLRGAQEEDDEKGLAPGAGTKGGRVHAGPGGRKRVEASIISRGVEVRQARGGVDVGEEPGGADVVAIGPRRPQKQPPLRRVMRDTRLPSAGKITDEAKKTSAPLASSSEEEDGASSGRRQKSPLTKPDVTGTARDMSDEA